MSLILHLSDLHLGSPSDWQLDHTDKFGLDRAAGDTKIDHLRHTLKALGEALRRDDRMLDSIVVSGDLTNANQPDGYEDFPDLVGQLGDRVPDADRIVVVPGNHDADWAVQPGKATKFKRFLDATRRTYRTPLIGGLDYDESSLERPTGSRRSAHPILDLPDCAVVALSSADFCGVEEKKTKTDWREVVNAYAAKKADPGAARRQVEADLRKLRVHDMARVDKRQLEALDDRLARAGLGSDAERDCRLRIAVLHHPIGPVTDREEIKAFETLANLEKVREFLYDHGFHVVLHGHKHESYLGWDWLSPAGDDLDATPRRVLVVGSPGDFRPRRVVCRLLEVAPDGDTPVAGAPRMRIIDVIGARVGQELKPKFRSPCISLAQPFVRSADVATPWVVRAKTADAAYQQLRDLPADLSAPRPVISVVEDPGSTASLPSNYPVMRGKGWLKDVVRWWQLANPEAVRLIAGSDFNHGERIYGRKDGIKAAVEALPSSKAITLLVDSEEAARPEREFPALTAIQLHARASPDEDGTRLDVVGIYRKQDLRLWWPINMAELAYVQNHALEFTSDNAKLAKPVQPGRLVAMASIGTHDNVLPQLAGTALDRAIDLHPQLAQRLALLGAEPRVESQPAWTEALADVGLRDGDKLLVPTIGLERLLDALKLQRDLGRAASGFRNLVSAVEALAVEADGAAKHIVSTSGTGSHSYWATKLRGATDVVLDALRLVARRAGVTWE